MKTNIKFLVMDVDGTLTDGKIYMSDNGELFKAFDIKDGCGIHDILPQDGIVPVIITARSSKILANRCKELDITEYHQGCKQKYDKLISILADYYKSTSGEYEAHLQAKEKGVTVIELTLSVPDEDTASAICANWQKKNQDIYQYLIRQLF